MGLATTPEFPFNVTRASASGSIASALGYGKNFKRIILFGSGSFESEFFSKLSGSSFEIVNPPKESLLIRTPAIANVQDIICETLGLTIIQLAQSCHETPEALYNWRQGILPRPSTVERLFRIYRATRDWREAGYPSPGSRLYEPLLGGRSLYDVLCCKPIDLDAIDFIGSRLAMEAIPMKPLQDPFA